MFITDGVIISYLFLLSGLGCLIYLKHSYCSLSLIGRLPPLCLLSSPVGCRLLHSASDDMVMVIRFSLIQTSLTLSYHPQQSQHCQKEKYYNITSRDPDVPPIISAILISESIIVAPIICGFICHPHGRSCVAIEPSINRFDLSQNYFSFGVTTSSLSQGNTAGATLLGFSDSLSQYMADVVLINRAEVTLSGLNYKE